MNVFSHYLDNIYDPISFASAVNTAVEKITKFKARHSFNAIAFTGTSGAAIAYPLSYLLQIPLICVRKSIRDNHFGRATKSHIEGVVNSKKYIIIDDCIASGKTIQRIRDAIKNHSIEIEDKVQPKLVGIYLYNNSRLIKSYDKIPLI